MTVQRVVACHSPSGTHQLKVTVMNSRLFRLFSSMSTCRLETSGMLSKAPMVSFLVTSTPSEQTKQPQSDTQQQRLALHSEHEAHNHGSAAA